MSSRLTPLLDALKRSGADEMRLEPGQKIFILRQGQRLEGGGEPLTAASIEALATERIPAAEISAIGPDGRTVAVVHDGDSYAMLLVHKPSGLSMSLRCDSSSSPAPTPSAAPARSTPASPRRPTAQSAVEAGPGHAIDAWLRRMVEMKASDLHLSPNNHPVVRIDGDIHFLEDTPPLASRDIEILLGEIMTPKARKEFPVKNDADMAYEVPGLARFRVNIFRDRHGVGTVMRQIPLEILTAEQLKLPKAILDLCLLSKGLVVVTGPTGSGKSTTLAAMVDYINKTRTDHIVTIEDPIEFVHENRRCLVNQREVGAHTTGFKNALRAALREDPDIVMVGEMRDLETIAIAIETAETGHLVFGTLHTTTAVSTIDRIIDQFPPDQQEQIRVMLADALRGIIAQVLCKKIGGGRVAALEVLLANTPVAALIRESKNFQIPSVMQTSRGIGMATMNDSLLALVKDKTIEPSEAYFRTTDKNSLLAQFKGAGINFTP